MNQCRSVLVTGGSGFIGTNLVEELVRANIPVCNADRNPPLNPRHSVVWKEVNILDAEGMRQVVRETGPSHVVHLAANTELAVRGRPADYSANVKGTEYVIRGILEQPSVRRLVVASSMLVCRPGYLPRHDEDYSPGTSYGESKAEAERITRRLRMKCEWLIIRPTTIWGPWNLRMERELFHALSNGYYVHPGGRENSRSYGYVGNTVHQIIKLLEAPSEQVDRKTLYVSDPPVRLREFVDAFSLRLRGRHVWSLPFGVMRILARVGDVTSRVGRRKFPLTSYRLKNMTEDNLVDIGPTLAVTGPPPYSMMAGVDLTVRWLQRMAGFDNAASHALPTV